MSLEHREREQLSAYLDGQLSDAERIALEAHLSTCEQCAETLAALRAAVDDLRLLAEATPSEQDAWALRSAIARARREQLRGPRWSRVAMASSASAAVLALIVGSVVLLGGGGDRGGLADGGDPAALEFAEDATGVPAIELLDQSFDQVAARALIGQGAGGTYAEGAPKDGNDGVAASEPQAGDTSSRSQMLAGGNHGAKIGECETSLFGDDRSVQRTAQRYIVADYNDVGAYFLLYFLPTEDSYELWVVARSDCSNVLLFEQRAA